jgi:hypothetical protein
LDSNKAIEFFVETGAEISGAVAGAIIGGAVAGPSGSIAGAVGGTAIEKVISKIGTEIKERVLSKRENKKIGATVTFTLLKIKEKLDSGKQLRDDNFFKEDITGRSSADEITEGVLFAAQKEHEEKKLTYYGNLLANIAFDKTITKELANQLISVADRLTYQQLKLLNLFVINQLSPMSILKQGSYTTANGYELISVLQDIYDLYRIGLLNGNGNVILEMGYINPSQIKVQGTGALLYNLMELSKIPFDEMEGLINMLK